MKAVSYFLISIFIAIGGSNIYAQRSESFTDKRDGKSYRTVEIGQQIWMAENLAYKTKKGCWAYGDDESNVNTYGYLYNWETANNVCPEGYHLPSEDEWIQLELFICVQKSTIPEDSYGNWNNIKKHLKANWGWEKNGNGTDKYGFTGLPGGIRFKDGKFYNIGAIGFWWSASSKSRSESWSRYLAWSSGNFNRYGNNRSGFSVRCLKD